MCRETALRCGWTPTPRVSLPRATWVEPVRRAMTIRGTIAQRLIDETFLVNESGAIESIDA